MVNFGGLPWWSSVWDSTLSLPRARVPSPVRELRSRKLQGAAKKKGKFYVLCILSQLKVKKNFLNLSLLPFFLQATPVSFHAHHSTETAPVKVTGDLHVARSYGQSLPWPDWPVRSICHTWPLPPSWPPFSTWIIHTLWLVHLAHLIPLALSSKCVQKATLPTSLLDYRKSLLASLISPLLPLPPTSLLYYFFFLFYSYSCSHFPPSTVSHSSIFNVYAFWGMCFQFCFVYWGIIDI